MEKINFGNNTTPALNATNLNKLQQNVEDEINLKDNKVGDLSNLQTEDKTNVVNAINEIQTKNAITKYDSSDISNWLLNNWSVNGANYATIDGNGLKTLTISIRNGTSGQIMSLPNNMIPGRTLIVPANNYTTAGYAVLYSEGIVTTNLPTGSEILISCTYF